MSTGFGLSVHSVTIVNMRQISVRVSDELLERIEVARGRLPRERWLRDVISAALGGLLDPVVAARVAEANAPLRDRLGSLSDGESLAPIRLKRSVPSRPFVALPKDQIGKPRK